MILLNDFQREPEDLVTEQLKAVETVLRSGWVILGKQVENFENSWAQWTGSKFAIGVANGMDALEIGLRALDLQPEDEVITTPMTAFATVLAIMRSGATPVLADIDPQTGLIDTKSVERCLSKRTKCLLPVHLYGRPANIDCLLSICEKNQVLFAEDCAQAHGAQHRNVGVGNFGTFGAWSFYPTKNLGAPGDAGCITTNDPELAKRARVLRNYGQSERYYHPELGLNSRLDELHAAILSKKLAHLKFQNEQRRNSAKFFRANIKNPRVRFLAQCPEHQLEVNHLFPLISDYRDLLLKHLAQHEIQSLIHYPVPIHHQKPCSEIKRDPKGLLNAEDFSKKVLSVPCHPFLNESEKHKIVEAINAF